MGNECVLRVHRGILSIRQIVQGVWLIRSLLCRKASSIVKEQILVLTKGDYRCLKVYVREGKGRSFAAQLKSSHLFTLAREKGNPPFPRSLPVTGR